jgi:hypothetical protein
MNGGKVYNSLNKLNNNVIKIIQRYTLPEYERIIYTLIPDIEFHTFFKCEKCKYQLEKFKHLEYNYICYKCSLLFK